jgi:hypothetical protein
MSTAGKPSPGTSKTDLVFMGLLLGLMGLGFLTQAIRFRMTFTGDEIVVTQIFSRRMAYDDLERIDWTMTKWGSRYNMGNVSTYVLVGKSGKRLKIISQAYKNKHDWARLLLAIADARGVQIDPKVRKQLDKASQEGYQQLQHP